MKKHVLIVGQKISTLTDYLDLNNYTYTVLKDIKRTKFPDKRFKRRVLCDFSNRETVKVGLKQIKHPVDAVIATYETYILPAAWIAEELNLPGIPVASAEACTDKFIMRELFAKAPEKISPDFAVIESEDDVLSFASSHEFPLIIKPANLSKSLLVTKSVGLEELLKNYHKTVESVSSIYKKYAPDRSPKLLIEEFMEGSIHSVDAFVDHEGNPSILDAVVDYQTGYDIGYDDNFHYSRLLPTKLSQQDKDALIHCAEVGVKALGMKSTPAHIEIIMTKDGPRIVEIGARNGGYRDRMHKLANDLDITGQALSLAFGESSQIVINKNENCAVIELFPKEKGGFSHISNKDRLHELPSFQYISIKAKPGAIVGKSSDGFKMCAVIILHNNNAEQFDKDLDFVKNSVEVQITPAQNV